MQTQGSTLRVIKPFSGCAQREKKHRKHSSCRESETQSPSLYGGKAPLQGDQSQNSDFLPGNLAILEPLNLSWPYNSAKSCFNSACTRRTVECIVMAAAQDDETLRLQEFDFSIVHKPSENHKVPDALSRILSLQWTLPLTSCLHMPWWVALTSAPTSSDIGRSCKCTATADGG